EFAMIEQEAGAKSSHVGELLENVIRLNPNFVDAQFLLGVRKTDDGRYAAAIDHLKIATRLRPRNSGYWHALGYAQIKAGLAADALSSARRAIATAWTAEEDSMAHSLITLATEQPPASRPKRPEITTPTSWNRRKGDSSVDGILVRFDCANDRPKML